MLDRLGKVPEAGDPPNVSLHVLDKLSVALLHFARSFLLTFDLHEQVLIFEALVLLLSLILEQVTLGADHFLVLDRVHLLLQFIDRDGREVLRR